MNIDELIDISDIVIDSTMSKAERIKDFHRQIKDPHNFRYGKVLVTLEFTEDGPTFEECIKSYLNTF